MCGSAAERLEFRSWWPKLAPLLFPFSTHHHHHHHHDNYDHQHDHQHRDHLTGCPRSILPTSSPASPNSQGIQSPSSVLSWPWWGWGWWWWWWWWWEWGWEWSWDGDEDVEDGGHRLPGLLIHLDQTKGQQEGEEHGDEADGAHSGMIVVNCHWWLIFQIGRWKQVIFDFTKWVFQFQGYHQGLWAYILAYPFRPLPQCQFFSVNGFAVRRNGN